MKLGLEGVEAAQTITNNDPALDAFTRIRYLRRIFDIRHGWHVMAAGYAGDRRSQYDAAIIEEHAAAFDALWNEYKQLPDTCADCATLYRGSYWNWPGEPWTHGMAETVADYRAKAAQA